MFLHKLSEEIFIMFVSGIIGYRLEKSWEYVKKQGIIFTFLNQCEFKLFNKKERSEK